MNDDPAQSSDTSYGDGGTTQNQQGQTQPQVSHQASPQNSLHASSSQAVSPLPSKEQAPVSEHITITDPAERMPDVKQELREFGVDVKTDEAKLELTREHQQTGMSHSPQSVPVARVLEEEEKPLFPMSYQTAEQEAKKESVFSSLRWLAVYVLRQMKIKNLTAEK